MATSIELTNFDQNNTVSKHDNEVLFLSEYDFWIFTKYVLVSKNQHSILLEISNLTNIKDVKNVDHTAINLNKVSYINIVTNSTLKKVLFWSINIVVQILLLFIITAPCAAPCNDTLTPSEIFTVSYLPVMAIVYYLYISKEYLTIYSDSGNKIKIDTNKVHNIDKLKQIITNYM